MYDPHDPHSHDPHHPHDPHDPYDPHPYDPQHGGWMVLDRALQTERRAVEAQPKEAA